MWVDVLVVAVAVVCAFMLLHLRALLMLVFPAMNVRRLPAGAVPPAAAADLYEKAAAELAALGFSPPQWVVIAPGKETPGLFALVAAVFCHEKKNALALVMPPLHLAAPNTLVTSFTTLSANGRKLTSAVRSIASEAFADEKNPAQTIGGDTFAGQWAQHRRWIKRFKEPAAPGFGSLETLDAHLPVLCFDPQPLIDAGKLWRDAQGFARPALLSALRLLRLYWARPRPKADRASVPLARQAMFATFNEHWQQRALPVRWQWLLLLASSAGFAVLGAVFWEPLLALMVLGAIVLHEGGHYLAMRVFGYRHVQMLALPLFGGVTLGVEQKPGATQRAWMAMMGPLPGIILGWALLFLAVASGAGVPSFAFLEMDVLLLVVNYLNLLPVPPLDGAHIVQAMLPPRWFAARTVFIVAACLIGAALAAYAGIYLLTLLALWQLAWVPSLLASDRAVRLLANDAAFAALPPAQQQRQALETLQHCAGETARMAQRLQQMKTVVGALTQTAMAGKHRAALATVYLGLLCLPLIFWGVAAMKTPAAPVPAAATLEAMPPPTNPERQKQAQQRVFLTLGGLNIPQLLARLPEPPPPSLLKSDESWLSRFRKAEPPPAATELPAPADPGKIAAAQTRLGLTFPGDYLALLAQHDGYPPLRLLPVAQVRRLSETAFFANADTQAPRPFYSFAFPPSSLAGSSMEAAPGQRVWRGDELQNCAVIGGLTLSSAIPDRQAEPGEVLPSLLWCPGSAFEQAHVVSLEETLWTPDFTTYLRYKVTQEVTQGMPARELAGSDKTP